MQRQHEAALEAEEKGEIAAGFEAATLTSSGFGDAVDDDISVGVGHFQAIDHHERFDVDIYCAAAPLKHLRQVGIAEK